MAPTPAPELAEFKKELKLIEDAYSRYFYAYEAAPLLIVNSERLNFVDNPHHAKLLLARIRSMRGRREFFNLAS